MRVQPPEKHDKKKTCGGRKSAVAFSDSRGRRLSGSRIQSYFGVFVLICNAQKRTKSGVDIVARVSSDIGGVNYGEIYLEHRCSYARTDGL